MSQKDLEARIRALEDAEAIRNLKAEYAAFCDDNYDADQIALLFTEDAVWESEGLGEYNGREEIREFFKGASKIFTFAVHYNINPKIEVNGDTAKARWFTFMPCIMGYNDGAHWMAGVDNEEYIRRDGKWMFSKKVAKRLFRTPFEEGWSKVRFT